MILSLCREALVAKEIEEKREPKGQKAHVVHQVAQARQDSQALLDPRVLLVHLVLRDCLVHLGVWVLVGPKDRWVVRDQL